MKKIQINENELRKSVRKHLLEQSESENLYCLYINALLHANIAMKIV